MSGREKNLLNFGHLIENVIFTLTNLQLTI